MRPVSVAGPRCIRARFPAALMVALLLAGAPSARAMTLADDPNCGIIAQVPRGLGPRGAMLSMWTASTSPLSAPSPWQVLQPNSAYLVASCFWNSGFIAGTTFSFMNWICWS